jgi:hypothetical protein
MPKEVQQELKKIVVSDLSDPSIENSDKPVVRALQYANSRTHYLVKFDVTKDPSGCSRTKKRKCKKCLEQKKRQDVRFYCITCGKNHSCYNNIDGRDCFKSHMKEIKCATRCNA